MRLPELLASYRRIAVTGGPRTGKSGLASQVRDRLVVHTDDWKDSLPFKDVPDVAIAAAGSGRVLVEGVQVARALRKGLAVDAVIWTGGYSPAQVKQGQRSMGTGTLTVFRDWARVAGDMPTFLVTPDGSFARVPAEVI